MRLTRLWRAAQKPARRWVSCTLLLLTTQGAFHGGVAYAESTRAGVSVTEFALLDSATLRAVKGFNPLTSGAQISQDQIGSRGIAIRAEIPRKKSAVVRFELRGNGKVIRTSDSRAPYIFRRSQSAVAKLGTGSFSLTATARTVGKKRRSSSSSTVAFSLLKGGGTKDGGSNNNPGGNVTPDSSIPNLASWKSNMLSWGRTHCQRLQDGSSSFDTKLAATYYDAQWVFYQIGDFTKDNYWYSCAQAAERIYRDQYVLANNGRVPGYWNFSHGPARDFLSTGDSKSKQAAILLSTNAAFASDQTPLNSTASANESREVAYAIMSYLNAETVGASHRSRTEALVAQALSHLSQWTVARNAEYVRPFMFSLTAHALISYDAQIGGNAKILPAIKTAADWMWNNTWLPGAKAFKYTDRAHSSGGTEPAPDLNLLIAPVYAWLWHRTGDTTYRSRADQIFAGGVQGAWLSNGKQYNQNYRWSFDYIKWRSLPPKR